MSNKYEVGYGKPPNHTQFKKGQSGNPRGRPKGSRNFSTDVRATLKARVGLTGDGKRKTVSTQLATLLQLRKKALSGDARALDRMIELARTYNDEEIAEAAAKLSETDAELLEAHNERVLRRAGKAQPDDKDDARNDAAQDTDAAQENNEALEEEDDDDWLR